MYMVRYDELKKLAKVLDNTSVSRLKEAAEISENLERRYMSTMRRKFLDMEKLIEYMIENEGDIDPNAIDFTDTIQMHAFDTIAAGIKIAETDAELLYRRSENKPGKDFDQSKVKLAKKRGRPKAAAIPRSLRDLMKKRDEYIKKRKPSARVKGIAQRLNEAYLKKVQSVWKKYAKEFIAGAIKDKPAIIEEVKAAGRTVFARAKTIVETETTYYYNKSRMQTYDKSPQVTHYLFVTVRDKATTKWCKDRRGLVYEKGSQILKDETPPVHWNCRSEILPLTPFNNYHRSLIEDENRKRENKRPEPLPPGWKSR